MPRLDLRPTYMSIRIKNSSFGIQNSHPNLINKSIILVKQWCLDDRDWINRYERLRIIGFVPITGILENFILKRINYCKNSFGNRWVFKNITMNHMRLTNNTNFSDWKRAVWKVLAGQKFLLYVFDYPLPLLRHQLP